jgi:hypothetical protein
MRYWTYLRYCMQGERRDGGSEYENDCHVFGHAPVRNSYFPAKCGLLNLHCTTTMSDDEEQYNVCTSL